jgi:hypothetical protein
VPYDDDNSVSTHDRLAVTVMESLLITLMAVVLGSGLTAAAAAIKYRADATGWRTSYDREKTRADEMAEEQKEARQAVRMANAIAEALNNKLRAGDEK